MTPANTDEQDREDMARLNAGHDAALNQLMERHSERLFHYLVRQLNNEADAADLAQETFVRIYHHRAAFKPSQRFSTWLFTIATNLIRDRFRWRTRHPEVSIDAPAEEGAAIQDALPAAGVSPGEQMAAEERAAAVRQAVESLPDDLRAALILSEYENLSHAEIGAVLNCSAKAVESRLYRARAHLRQRLAELVGTQ